MRPGRSYRVVLSSLFSSERGGGGKLRMTDGRGRDELLRRACSVGTEALESEEVPAEGGGATGVVDELASGSGIRSTGLEGKG